MPPPLEDRVFRALFEKPISGTAAGDLAIVLHELATNALKRGAQSVSSGGVELSLSIARYSKPWLYLPLG
jgi:two-component sensor histidine kinase